MDSRPGPGRALEISLGDLFYRFLPHEGCAVIEVYKPDGSLDKHEYKTVEEGAGYLNFFLMPYCVYDFNKGLLRALNEQDIQ